MHLSVFMKAYVTSNTSACNCPDACDSVWYTTEISSGNGPNPTADYPSELIERIQKFRIMNKTVFNIYAK